uniref:Zinc finger LSD1-type domain-containing protein n=1 Tax=Kalanchoe fedtschenkoi TaxID=63787 RepID=A0A7N0RDY0_KALFE
MSGVKEEEGEDVKEVKQEEVLRPPVPLLAGLIKQEAMECQPVRSRFRNSGEVGGADGSFCPTASVGDFLGENRGVDPMEMKMGDELSIAEEGDDDAGLPPGWGAARTKVKGIFLPPESIETDRMKLEIEVEELKPSFSSEVNDKGSRLAGGEAADTEDGGSVVSLGEEKVGGVSGAEDEDGPPPGWEAAVTNDLGPGSSVETIPLEIKMEEVQPTKGKLGVADAEKDDDDDGPPPGWEAAATNNGGAEKEPLVKQESCKLEKGKEKECPPPCREPMAAPAPRPPLPSKPLDATSEMGQVVCGSCRSLLSYPKGAKYVRCLCCQTVSFVLEAHQVGQVYCGRCAVLLMYYYGCPAVRCSNCQFITQIGPHNRRPPLSEQGGTLQSQLALLRPTKSVAQ